MLAARTGGHTLKSVSHKHQDNSGSRGPVFLVDGGTKGWLLHTHTHTHTHIYESHNSSPCLFKNKTHGGFPGGAMVKNPPGNAGDTGLSPGPGRSHMPRSN